MSRLRDHSPARPPPATPIVGPSKPRQHGSSQANSQSSAERARTPPKVSSSPLSKASVRLPPRVLRPMSPLAIKASSSAKSSMALLPMLTSSCTRSEVSSFLWERRSKSRTLSRPSPSLKTIRSDPLPAQIQSLPAPPSTVSSPSPAYILSLPSPPSRQSSPLRPNSESL